MIILGIETSCDETAVSVVRGSCRGTGRSFQPQFSVLAQIVASQTKHHQPWGGVVPNLAKREHEKMLMPVLKRALAQSKLLKSSTLKTKNLKVPPWEKKIKKILAREPELLEQFRQFVPKIARPKIDAIAVTLGPGLEPALWVGLNFAKAMAFVWQKPLIAVNHLEGHIMSVDIRQLKFPVLALIVSGGHTELVVMSDWFKYKIIGQTRDDAAGECFDKIARLLGLPYPGGPALSKLARSASSTLALPLPRPMINSPDLDFSFSGLKTAVLYRAREFEARQQLTENIKAALAADFEQAVCDVLIKKTIKAGRLHQSQTIIVSGGVGANRILRRQFAAAVRKSGQRSRLIFPPAKLSTDNATMIAKAGYLRWLKGLATKTRNLKNEQWRKFRAQGRLVLK